MNNSKKSANIHQEIVGLMPAGGQATRLGPLPCSKELYPVGFRIVDDGRSLRPKVVCHYLLEKMRLAHITKAYIILREGKWDIPAYLGDGKMLDIHLAYLMMDLSFGVPYTLDQAYHFVKDAIVAFGFPDVIFQPDDAFQQLLARQANTKADIVLGVFPAHDPQKVDMVELDGQGRVSKIQIKPTRTHLHHTWIIAVWTPEFTRFMHEYLLHYKKTNHFCNSQNKECQELFVGNLIQAAIANDLQAESVIYPHGTYLDIGTPDELAKALCSEIVSRGFCDSQ